VESLGEDTILLQFTAFDALVTSLDLLLVLSGNIIRVTAQAVAGVDGVHLAQRPVASLKKALVGADAVLDVTLLFKTLGHHHALDECVLWTPAKRLCFPLH